MFERFSDHARSAIVFAQDEARQLNHSYIGTEHLLLGILRQDEDSHEFGASIGFLALEAYNITYSEAYAKITQIVGMGSEPVTASHLPFMPGAKRIMEISLREALLLSHNYIGTEHLLLAMISTQDDVTMRVLNDLNHMLVYSSAKQTIQALLDAAPTTGALGQLNSNPALVFPGYTGHMTPALFNIMKKAVVIAGGASLKPEHVAQAISEA